MTRKELQNTIIVAGMQSVYITKRNKSDTVMSEVRREITENEILRLIIWYSKKKFDQDKTDEYTITDSDGKALLTVNRESNNQI